MTESVGERGWHVFSILLIPTLIGSSQVNELRLKHIYLSQLVKAFILVKSYYEQKSKPLSSLIVFEIYTFPND